METAPGIQPRRVTDIEYKTLRHELRGNVLVVTIDHPDNKYNLVDTTLMEEMAALMSALRNQTEARAVVLTGSGKCFSAGGSFELMKQLDKPEFGAYISRQSRHLINDLLQVPVPIVCAMNGPAIGFGATWVLLSDISFAGSDATLSDPHVLRGINTPDGAALWNLVMSPQRAKRFLLTGEELSAAQAEELGLITFVTEPGEAFDKAMEFAEKLAGYAPSAVAHTKLLCNIYIREALDKSFDLGAAWECADFRSSDHKEAVAAFRERRTPVFTGT
jgi:enoyl-CoA hydratase